MPYQKSPYFNTPSSPKKLWKYMHIDKFLTMLDDDSLYFPNIDSFIDKHEGTLSNISLQEVKNTSLLDENTPIKKDGKFYLEKDQMEKYFSEVKDLLIFLTHSFPSLIQNFSNHLMFCNCWFMAENESHSMWAEYGDKSPTSVAIQTTLSRLIKSLEKTPYNIHIGKVKYKDYETEHIEGYEEFTSIDLRVPQNVLDLFYAPIMHKRNIYKDEHEVRAIISFESFCQRHFNHIYTSKIPFYTDKLFSGYYADSDPNKTHIMENICKGYSIEVNLQTLLERVVMSPSANEYFKIPLKHILEKHNLNVDIVETSKINSSSYWSN